MFANAASDDLYQKIIRTCYIYILVRMRGVYEENSQLKCF